MKNVKQKIRIRIYKNKEKRNDKCMQSGFGKCTHVIHVYCKKCVENKSKKWKIRNKKMKNKKIKNVK